MYTSYKEMQKALEDQNEINGNSVTAYHEKHMEDGTHHYIVKSYATEILDYNRTTEKVEYFDNSSYSPTTSRLQNMLIDVFSLNGGKHARD